MDDNTIRHQQGSNLVSYILKIKVTINPDSGIREIKNVIENRIADYLDLDNNQVLVSGIKWYVNSDTNDYVIDNSTYITLDLENLNTYYDLSKMESTVHTGLSTEFDVYKDVLNVTCTQVY